MCNRLDKPCLHHFRARDTRAGNVVTTLWCRCGVRLTGVRGSTRSWYAGEALLVLACLRSRVWRCRRLFR